MSFQPKAVSVLFPAIRNNPHMKNHHAVTLGKKGGHIGGRSRSAAKIGAAKANGKKGGRPKKETSP